MNGGPRRDVVVIGASAGGVETLSQLVARLPRGLAAAVFIVLHVSPGGRSRLPEILSRRGPLPARHARDGDGIEHGRILVAPPDLHLVLGAASVRLVRGPRQNSTRPAIDALFRSAAANHRSRVVGVVLSGYLEDGAEGLREIIRAGGVGIAQDPREAINPEMPENSIARAGPRVLKIAAIAEAIGAMADGRGRHEEAREQMTPDRKYQRLEPERPDVQIGAADAPGAPTGLTCPECHGVLWIGPDADSQMFHCRVGHAYSLETLVEQQRVAVEQALWAAVRSLREQAAVAAHIAGRAEVRDAEGVARKYRERERSAIENAETLERVLMESEPEEDLAEA